MSAWAKARFWPWHSSKSHIFLSRCSLFARKRDAFPIPASAPTKPLFLLEPFCRQTFLNLCTVFPSRLAAEGCASKHRASTDRLSLRGSASGAPSYECASWEHTHNLSGKKHTRKLFVRRSKPVSGRRHLHRGALVPLEGAAHHPSP